MCHTLFLGSIFNHFGPENEHSGLLTFSDCHLGIVHKLRLQQLGKGVREMSTLIKKPY